MYNCTRAHENHEVLKILINFAKNEVVFLSGKKKITLFTFLRPDFLMN